jgi:D-alanine--poly(phosphoribitol) ligase subunit 1
VAIELPNSAAFVLAALGCLWLGAPFVPLPLEHPPVRVERVLRDCDPKVVIARSGQPSTGLAPPRVTAGPFPSISDDPERDAYMIYTSGTTGAPKAVRVPERALVSAALTAAGGFGLDRSTRSLCVSSFHFDGSYGTNLPDIDDGGLAGHTQLRGTFVLTGFFPRTP